MNRRSFLVGVASVACTMGARGDDSRPNATKADALSVTNNRAPLLNGPIELTGDWGRMIPNSALKVVERMRAVCFDGFRLVSDDQPERLRVEERTSGPVIWLHADETKVGWIIVNIGERDWSKLAYQFGHELGHVTANSWRPDAKPGGPCQWLEEALVEAFSLRGLALLADSWSRDPPFNDDSGFGAAVAVYRQNIVENYGKLAIEQGNPRDLGLWFRKHRAAMEGLPVLNAFAQAASLGILAEYERNPSAMEALGAINRWPGRSTIPLEDYFEAWKVSCKVLRASADLPARLQKLLGLG